VLLGLLNISGRKYLLIQQLLVKKPFLGQRITSLLTGNPVVIFSQGLQGTKERLTHLVKDTFKCIR
jgi:hypothetical protein